MKRVGVGAKRRGGVGREGEEPEIQGETAPEERSEPKRKLSVAQLRYCRKLVSHMVAEEMPGIVKKFAREAKLGSIEHAQALLKLSGVEPGKAAVVDKPKRYKSFAGELLKEIRKKPPAG